MMSPQRLGSWTSSVIDAVVPGRIERFLPLPRYHPWLFGIGMLGWGMNRQRALMTGSVTSVFGLQFPMVPSFQARPGGFFGSGTAMGGLNFIAMVIGVSAIVTVIQEAN